MKYTIEKKIITPYRSKSLAGIFNLFVIYSVNGERFVNRWKISKMVLKESGFIDAMLKFRIENEHFNSEKLK